MHQNHIGLEHHLIGTEDLVMLVAITLRTTILGTFIRPVLFCEAITADAFTFCPILAMLGRHLVELWTFQYSMSLRPLPIHELAVLTWSLR